MKNQASGGKHNFPAPAYLPASVMENPASGASLNGGSHDSAGIASPGPSLTGTIMTVIEGSFPEE